MEFDNELIKGKLIRWGTYLNKYKLPDWQDIPDLGLYMEQVVSLLRGCLSYLPPELQEEQYITPATINNYVRKKFMPEPIRKKYYRVHIAYLIMICTMKHSLSIPTLQTMIPMGIDTDEVERIYSSFVRCTSLAAQYFSKEVESFFFDENSFSGKSSQSGLLAEELVAISTIISGLSRVLAEKLLLLNGKTLEDGGSIAPWESI